MRVTFALRAVGLAVGLFLIPGSVDPARAGTYVMRNCDVPGHPDSVLGPWRTVGTLPGIDVVDACATGGGVSVAVGGVRQMPSGNVAIGLSKPVGARSPIKLVKAVLWYAARLAGTGQPIDFWTVDYRADGTYHLGLSNNPPGSENLVGEQVLGSDTVDYQVGIHCGQPSGVQTGEPCFPSESVPLLLRGMEVTLSEDVPPTVLRPGGTLLAGGAQTGLRTLTYSASDAQSGLARVDVLLDGSLVASRDLTSTCSYSDFTVCRESHDDTLQIDTRTVPNGLHRITLRALDAAGNERTFNVAEAVEIANPPLGTATSAPVYALGAGFAGSSQRTLTVSYGARVAIRGRLTSVPSQGLAGASIEVLEQIGKRETLAGRAQTRAGGTFSYTLRATGPSRSVRLAYPTRGSGRAISRALRLRVRAAARMRASLTGRVIHFSGVIRSRPIPKRGKIVRMEGHAPTSRWTTFQSLRTDRRGRFSGEYRLRIRRPGVALKVRALVPRENGYGYLSSRSRAVTLRVR